MSSPVDILLKSPVSWLADSGPDDDIAISSRIRLARNLATIPFPINADLARRREVLEAVEQAAGKTAFIEHPIRFEMSELNELDRQFLLERRLVSREFCSGREGSALVVNADESIGLMINEEDHIRMQVMRSGFVLKEIWTAINELDDRLSKELSFAFEERIGYLTSCPTNVGTGMRASVMLHLPALTLAGQIGAVVQGVGKLGLTVRGIYGEGSESIGNLYQVSNQSTLGESEEQIVQRLDTIIRQIINHEKNARQRLIETRKNFLLDNIGRAYGTLRYSYLLSSKEALNSLSSLRMGVDMSMFASLHIHTVNELFLMIQPAHLQKYAKRMINSEERDALRAEIMREKLQATKKSP